MISASASPKAADPGPRPGSQRPPAPLRTSVRDLTDAALAGRAQSGDRDAFGELIRRHQAAVRRACRAVTGHEHDADDAAQDAFLSALDRIETYDPKRPFGPWLMRIATNAAIDLLRRRAVRKSELLDESLSAASQLPARDAEQAELRQRLAAALAALPERQRVAITLFDLEGYPHAEIAEVLGIPEGTVRSDVFHARRKLRESLGVYAPASDEKEE